MNTYKTPANRGQNAAVADSRKTISDDGTRSVIGRNQKCAGPDHTYEIVRCYTIKEKVGGKWQTIDTHLGEEAAAEWVGKDVQ